MDRPTRQALAQALGSQVRAAVPLAGGDINEAYRVELRDGRRIFVKTRGVVPEGMYAAEAEGLRWLHSALSSEPTSGLADADPSHPRDELRTPRVLALSDRPGAPAFLALELLEPGARHRDFEELLGRGLARLHQSGAPSFGFPRDGFIGPLPQSNRPAPSWAEFYRRERLQAQLALEPTQSLLPSALRRHFDTLLDALESLVGPEEPPARLHGDLWSGNLLIAPDGRPALIDPAAYGGHREMDLAMMRLFGGFSPRVFAAYEEVFPLSPGHAERVALWQLYPLLVHVNLFGGAYVAQLARAAQQY